MSAARERAGRALYEDLGVSGSLPWEGLPASTRETYAHMGVVAHASLDETDPALVEAMAKALHFMWFPLGDYDTASKTTKANLARAAVSAIIAARNHITGEAP